MKRTGLVLLLALLGTGCSDSKTEAAIAPEAAEDNVVKAMGLWITDVSGNVMPDPQTSGLTAVGQTLYTLSDGSAAEHMQRKLHAIDTASAVYQSDDTAFAMASRVRRSCFSGYLQDEPDLEALVVDPQNPDVFYTVTEDATRTGALSMRCQSRFENTGSTDYPTLLVRLERQQSGNMMMTHVRPVQFPLAYEVGDFPNDGIEGMALADDRTLYLGLEKDAAGQPRIFSLTLSDDFWASDDFAVVTDTRLPLPRFSSGNHPVNGLTWYRDPASQRAFLLSAARNDNELWVTPVDGAHDTVRVPMQFLAPTKDTSGQCDTYEVMDNASIEGLVVIDNTLWLINDPWKKNYLKNIQCESARSAYEQMAPLLFSVDMDKRWFTPAL
ncbi:hypothetical protein [Alteromonas sp. CYL-A6]|uniref:hypothetical protein n=1 Tax=Alteromonas nitratireducens TaxID=3390813 RepID=UPI0034A936A0